MIRTRAASAEALASEVSAAVFGLERIEDQTHVDLMQAEGVMLYQVRLLTRCEDNPSKPMHGGECGGLTPEAECQ